MVVRIELRSSRQWLSWLEYALFAAGSVALVICGLVMLESRLYQQLQRRQFEQRLHNAAPAAISASRPAPVELRAAVRRIDIPRLGLSVMVEEGADAQTLRLAAGHIPGTALPGGPGNVGIAGHRDTFFRPLRGIKKDDTILLSTANGTYRYAVESAEVVPPTRVEVLNPTPEPSLTLVTCYPFSYIGPAPKRFIVRAREMAEDP